MIISGYITNRLKPLQFAALAVLLSLLIPFEDFLFLDWSQSVLYLFFSFLAFRFLDDAGSVHFDRIHYPNRSYLSKDNYPKFLKWTGLFLLIYVLVNSGISLSHFYIISILILLSIVAYLLFGKKGPILKIIPLVKYPVILWILTSFSAELDIISIVLSSFFIIFIYDLLDDSQAKIKKKGSLLIAILLCGALVFHPWNAAFAYLFILLPIIIIFPMQKWDHIKYFSVIYYPILVLIQSL